jgi:hypothetical protein
MLVRTRNEDGRGKERAGGGSFVRDHHLARLSHAQPRLGGKDAPSASVRRAFGPSLSAYRRSQDTTWPPRARERRRNGGCAPDAPTLSPSPHYTTTSRRTTTSTTSSFTTYHTTQYIFFARTLSLEVRAIG